MLDELGLEPALHAHIQEFSRRWPLQATFESAGVGRLPAEVELVLYRVVQEALSNVAKHAGASQVDAHLTREGNTLQLLVQDNGCGFDVEETMSSRGAGLGFFGMEERLALIGGVLRVESAIGAGTSLSAEVHLQDGHWK